MSEQYDAIILGGGPAGLTAAIYMARARQKVLVVDTGVVGGQMVLTHEIANYPGVPSISGFGMGNTMKKQAKGFGAKIISQAEVLKVTLDGAMKSVEIEDEGTFQAPAVILAMGGEPRSLGLSSEESFKGKGISYCATCDGDFFQDQDIVVVGGGNSALEEAVSLTQYAKSVTVVHQFDHFQAYPHAIQEAEENEKISFRLESEVVEFLGNEKLEGVRIRNNKGTEEKLTVTGTFIFIGYVPRTASFKGMVDMNDQGEILADEDMKTSVEGVFAAGDCRKKRYRQVTTAVADGTIAALSAMEFLRNV